MAYVKTTWANNQAPAISSSKLNKIENGIENNDTRLTTAEGEIDNVEAVIGNETDAYSASSTYALGSLVIYNSLLYKCTTAITVAEAWTIGHWTQVSLTSEVNDMKAKILWTNPNPNSVFEPTTINLENEDYDFIEIIYFTDNNAVMWKYLKSTGKIKYMASEYIFLGGYSSNRDKNDIPQMFTRNAVFGSTKSNIGFEKGSNWNGTTNSTRNYACIPLYIIGYKTGLFS